jgi:hypothetical protein
MGYDLVPNNKKSKDFHMGAFSYTILLEACNYLFPFLILTPAWICAFEADERMGCGAYPLILSNDGFQVTEEEAKIMARMVRNYVAIQQVLYKDENAAQTCNITIIRSDFIKKFKQFADWAEESKGFKIE